MDLVDLFDSDLEPHIFNEDGFCVNCGLHTEEMNDNDSCLQSRERHNRGIGSIKDIVDRNILQGREVWL